MKKSTIKAGLNVFSYFQPEDLLNLCLNFNESHLIYTYKHCSYNKECILYIISKEIGSHPLVPKVGLIRSEAIFFFNCGMHFQAGEESKTLRKSEMPELSKLSQQLAIAATPFIVSGFPSTFLLFLFSVKGWNIIVTQTSCIKFCIYLKSQIMNILSN